MATRNEKLVIAIFAAVILLIAVSLELAGSFVPQWTFPANKTAGDVRFSLWTRVECWDIICRTTNLRVKWTTQECIEVNGKDECTTTTGYKIKPKTECFEANYCNKTWHHEEEYGKVPSLLIVSKAFVTPGIVSGVIALILYIIKIILMLKSPMKRLHLKAAYLTFAAIAGAAAGVGVIIFCVMLNKEVFILGWAPSLPGVGGLLQLFMAFGGYLSWRNVSIDEDDFDDDSLSPIEMEKTNRKRFDIPWARSISANSATSSASASAPAGSSNV